MIPAEYARKLAPILKDEVLFGLIENAICETAVSGGTAIELSSAIGNLPQIKPFKESLFGLTDAVEQSTLCEHLIKFGYNVEVFIIHQLGGYHRKYKSIKVSW